MLAPAILKDHLINHARPLIYSSNQPPLVIHWLAEQFLRLPQLNAQRSQLFRNIAHLQTALGIPLNPSPIVPYIVGENAPTLALANHLCEQGISVAAIRHPTVAKGYAQLRISVSAAHRIEDLDRLANMINTYYHLPHYD